MPVRARYVPDHKDFGRYMMSDEARQAPIAVARDIVAELAVTVKRSTRPGPHLADSYEVDEHSEPVILDGNPRVGAAVISDHPGAAPEEFGGARNRKNRWMGKVGAKYHVAKGAPK
jgi:hypothetical protein